MKSKITISMDYVAKTPFIKIQHEHSDDERDIMIREFLSSMGGDVRFAKFQYEDYSPNSTSATAGIRPIPFVNLQEEVKTMQMWIDHVDSNILESPKFLNIHNNSQAFEKFLEAEGIQYKPNGHFTSVDNGTDLFNLGIKWEKYRELNEPKKQS